MNICVGDVVLWCGSFGEAPEKEAVVESIERSSMKRDKYGDEVDSIPYEMKDYGVFNLDNGHWCYGEQIVGVKK